MRSLLFDALRSLFIRAATETQPEPENLRTLVRWDPTTCTGCGLCAKDCPTEALTITVIDRKAKQFVVQYDAAMCIYCGQCAASCNRDAIRLTNDRWRLAVADPSTLIVEWRTPDAAPE